jgi:hypothetical protein
MAELLAGAATRHPPYASLVRAAHQHVNELAQQCMSHTIAGNPRAAVKALVTHGAQTRNAKLIDTARLTLQRHRDKIPEATTLEGLIQDMLGQYGPSSQAPSLGQPIARSAGGLSLVTAADAKPVPNPSPT